GCIRIRGWCRLPVRRTNDHRHAGFEADTREPLESNGPLRCAARGWLGPPSVSVETWHSQVAPHQLLKIALSRGPSLNGKKSYLCVRVTGKLSVRPNRRLTPSVFQGEAIPGVTRNERSHLPRVALQRRLRPSRAGAR